MEKIENVLFLDIETVPLYKNYNNMPERLQRLWNNKSAKIQQPGSVATPEELYSRAGIYAEFGKIICISVGFVSNETIRMKSFYGHDEKEILVNFKSLLEHSSQQKKHLCAHNGKEFDFPYLCRRMLINGISLPPQLDIAGKKPWEIPHLDTMELWKFGDFKHYTSLELLAAIFDIPTPKDDIKGSDVHRVYWEEDDLERIEIYCRKDVITIIRLYMRYLSMEPIPDESVVVVP